MPIKRELYPVDWEAISRRVRAEANQICEWCGKPNGKIVTVIPLMPGTWWDAQLDMWRDSCGAPAAVVEGSLLPTKQIRIILTVAHLDQNPSNNDRFNLAALCQRCHLVHDNPYNCAKAADTRARAKEAKA